MPIEKRHGFAQPSPEIEADLVRRASAAWQQVEEGEGAALATFKLHKGLGYVVLRDASDKVLTVYRVRSDNLALRRLKRWPVWVEK